MSSNSNILSQLGQKKKREAVRRLSQNASRRHAVEGRSIRRSTGIGITSREYVFGKRSHDDAANPPKKGKLFGKSSATLEDTNTSSVFGNTNPPGSFRFNTLSSSGTNSGSQAIQNTQGSFGFNKVSSSGSNSGSQATNKLFSFINTSAQVTNSETVPGSQTSTVFSIAADKPHNLFQVPSDNIDKNEGTSIATTSFSSSIQPQTTVSFGSPSVKTSQTSFAYPSVPGPISGFNAPAFSNTAALTNEQETDATTSIGFPSSSNQTGVFGSKFGQSGFSFSKVKKEEPLKRPNQPFPGTKNVFGKIPGQSEASTNQDVGFPPKKSGNSPEEKTISDVSTLKTLVVREMPEIYNKNAWVRRFYSRFGEVVKVLCNPAKKSATISFKTHEAAKLAKLKGKFLRKDINPVSIFWKQERKRSTSSPQDVSELARKHFQAPVKPMTKERVSTMEQAALDPHSLPAAMTTGERFKVLELIDTKLREGVTKASDISTAKAVQGICRDMCPEKERYMREDRRRLHVYEIIPGTGSSLEDNPQMDHAKTIKEYDRSAADKEEPLPHELRPTPTLTMTMNYLVTNIMDIGADGQWGDWFDFLWNRTRAIRKDITQQHLCDVESVDLIEKTARFHIFCAHYLCDQDFSVFDPRINTENLTKCLQTLKQFYDDLYKNQGVICPNEAEFRTYDILLNLNEGDTLRQIMTYREEVHSSPTVKFAMDVFHALDSNNFVRFFRLVRSSGYLCACVLHRYFTQVRKQALRIMNYSLSVPNKEMSFPLNELADLLAFEGDEEAGNFCSFHGLTLNESCVVFIRASFIEPESGFPGSRAYKVIESKRSCLIGEVVYNGRLPPPSSRQPTSSFDQSGRYVGDVHVLPAGRVEENVKARPGPEVQFKGFSETAQFKEFPRFGQQTVQQIQPIEPPKSTLQINIEEVKEATRSLFLEVIYEMLVEVTGEVYNTVQGLLKVGDELLTELEEETVLELIQETANNAMLDEQRQQLLKAQQEALLDTSTSAVAEQLVGDVVAQECLEVAAHVYCAEQKKMIAECKEKAAKEISQNLLEDTMKNEVKCIVEESYKEAKEGRRTALSQIGQSICLHRKGRYFNKWVRSYQSRVRLKNLLNEFPAHAPFTSTEDQLTSLIGPQDDTRTKVLPTIRIFGDELNISECLIRRQAELRLIRTETLRPVDIPLLLANSFTQKNTAYTGCTAGSPMDWKLLLSFPGPCPPINPSMIRSQRICVSPSLIREKFRQGTLPADNRVASKVELLSLYSSEIQNRWSVRTRCRVCTLAYFGVPSNTDVTELVNRQQFKGTSAIIILVNFKELQTYAGRQEARTRVQRLVRSKPALPAIPAVVLLLQCDVTRVHLTNDLILDSIGAKDLQGEGHISNIQIARVGSPIEAQHLDNSLQEIVTWLDQHSQQAKLESDSLTNFLEEGLQRYFYTLLYEDIATRKKARLGQQSPEAVIGLYNSVIEHLAAVASSDSLGLVSWPITEFCSNENKDLPNSDWNSDANLSSLSSVILSLCLPPPPPGAEHGTWDSEAALCHEFVRGISFATCSLTQRVNWILEHRRYSLQAIDFLSSSPQLTAAQLPWTQVIEACVSSVMTSLHSNPVLFEMEVFYLQSEFEEFVPPDFWSEAVVSSKREYSAQMEEKRLQLTFPVKTRNELAHESVLMVDEELKKIINKSNVSWRKSHANSSYLDDSIYGLKNQLGSALHDARQHIYRFDQILEESSLADDSSNKKRKAECHPDRKNLNETSCSNSVGLESMRDDLSTIRKKIRSERASQQLAELRLRLLLDEPREAP